MKRFVDGDTNPGSFVNSAMYTVMTRDKNKNVGLRQRISRTIN